MIHQAKDTEVPIVVVGNKSDLVTGDQAGKAVPMMESIEAVVTFDWENGYVESSAKERKNINKIFKELLQQAKTRYDFSAMPAAPVTSLNHGKVANNNPLGKVMEENLKRRQSLPAVPAGFKPGHTAGHTGHNGPLTQMMNKMHLTHKSVDRDQQNSGQNSPKGTKRRSSLAALRRDSCKIS